MGTGVDRGDGGFVDCGPLRLDLLAYRLRRGERSLGLTLTEARLLERMMRRPGEVLPRAELEAILPSGGRGERALTTAISRLRRPLTALGCDQWLRSVRGQGYAIAPPAETG